MDVMDWDWIIEGERASEGRRMRRLRRIRARHARRAFPRHSSPSTVVVLPGGRGRRSLGLAWKQAGAARRAPNRPPWPRRTTIPPRSTRAWSPRPASTTGGSPPRRMSSERRPARTGPSMVISGSNRTRNTRTCWIRRRDHGDHRDPVHRRGPARPARGRRVRVENGAGHLHGTSLPVGGQSTHSVITGHTGVADKALFTRLTELRKGDVF